MEEGGAGETGETREEQETGIERWNNEQMQPFIWRDYGTKSIMGVVVVAESSGSSRAARLEALPLLQQQLDDKA